MTTIRGISEAIKVEATMFLRDLNSRTGRPRSKDEWSHVIHQIGDKVDADFDLEFSATTALPILRYLSSPANAPSQLPGICNYDSARVLVASIGKAGALQHATFADNKEFTYQISNAATGFLSNFTLPKSIGSLSTTDETYSIEACALAFLVLGAAFHVDTELGPIRGEDTKRKAQRDLAIRLRLPSALSSYRKRDIQQLISASSLSYSSFEELYAWAMTQPEEMDRLEFLVKQSAQQSDEYLRNFACVWPQQGFDFWSDTTKLSSEAHGLLQQMVEYAAPRGDILISEEMAISTTPQGFEDALLAIATAHAGDVQNASWHEKNVAMELRKVWGPSIGLQANFRWIKSSGKPTVADLDRPSHPGEIDALALGRDLLIDVQAKSAVSFKAATRENTPVSDALSQHVNLSSALNHGVWAVKHKGDGKYTVREKFGDLGQGNRTHIPITVGTDVVHLWAVGGSGINGGTARVLTTLDHLRIVNEYVPELLRPAYWLDRYAQENHHLRFMDEIDFLENWLILFRESEEEHRMAIAKNFVMSRDSTVETAIAIENSLGSVEGKLPELDKALRTHREQQARMQPLSSMPRLSAVLKELRRTSPSDYLLMIRSIPGNRIVAIESKLADDSAAAFRGGALTWAFVPSTYTVETSSEFDFLLQRTANSWKISRLASASRIASSWSKPSFRIDMVPA